MLFGAVAWGGRRAERGRASGEDRLGLVIVKNLVKEEKKVDIDQTECMDWTTSTSSRSSI
jgi:hypothetical protein